MIAHSAKEKEGERNGCKRTDHITSLTIRSNYIIPTIKNLDEHVQRERELY